MIRFACQCGHRFSLPDDQAGNSLQCPACHRLVDVPTLSELPGLANDGTYALEPSSHDPTAAQQRFTQFFHAINRDGFDAEGNEKDLRPTEDDFANLGAPLGLAPESPAPKRQAPPKYDPETGELIRPFEIAPVPVEPIADVPMARVIGARAAAAYVTPPSLTYATHQTTFSVPRGGVPLELFAPTNMLVMAFPFFCHLFGELCLIIWNMAFPVVGLFAAFFVILAHYGNVVYEIGSEDKDDLPRPLGNLQLWDDLWLPFCNVVGSLMLCYAPGVVAFYKLGGSVAGVFALGALTTAGTIVFPAVLLTMVTGGTMANLRPDRLLAVIRVSGSWYALALAEWVFTAVGYGAALVALHVLTFGVFVEGWKRVWLVPAAVGVAIAVYVAHLFLWHLALLYRAKSPQFPWVLQRHEPTGRKGAGVAAIPADRERAARRAAIRNRYLGGKT